MGHEGEPGDGNNQEQQERRAIGIGDANGPSYFLARVPVIPCIQSRKGYHANEGVPRGPLSRDLRSQSDAS